MTTNRKRMLVLICVSFVLFLSASAWGAFPATPLKVDLGGAGVDDASWYDAGPTGSEQVNHTFEGVGVLLVPGGGGMGLGTGNWAWSNASPLGDGYYTHPGPILPRNYFTLTLSGLTPNGLYEMTSYHNGWNSDWWMGNGNIDITAEGTVVVSNQPQGIFGQNVSYTYQFNADASGNAVIDIRSMSGGEAWENSANSSPFINGFELAEIPVDQVLFRFSESESEQREDMGPALIDVELLNAAVDETYSVDYAVSGGTADSNDYTLTTPTLLTFDPCETVKTISINIINDGAEEADETIILQLSNPTNGAILAEPNSHTYTIINPPPPGWLGVDFNKSGLSPEFWVGWTGENSDSTSTTINGVTVTLTNETTSGHGNFLWVGDYTAGGSDGLERMVEDLAALHGGDSCGGDGFCNGDILAMGLSFSGLEAGTEYEITTWHNHNWNTPTFDISVDGEVVIEGLAHTYRENDSDNAAYATFTFITDSLGDSPQIIVAGDTPLGDPGENAHLQLIPNINGFEMIPLGVDWMKRALNPNPEHGSTDHIPSQVTELSWTPGTEAVEHAIYFGESFEAVDLASDPWSGVGLGVQGPNSIPITVYGNVKYFWRVDEHNGDDSWTTGKVWNFETGHTYVWDDMVKLDINKLDEPSPVGWTGWTGDSPDATSTTINGGDIELVSFEDDNTVKVRLQGACSGCPGAAMTLKMGVERMLKEKIPEVKELIAVN